MNSLSSFMLLVALAAVTLYLLVGGLLWMRLLNRAPVSQWPKQQVIYPGLLAVALHGWILIQYLFTPAGLDIGFFTILTLTGWLVALLLLLAALSRPIDSLGIIVLPFTALSLILRLASDHHNYLAQHLPVGLEFHILVSILAYSLLSIAVVQALLLYFQDAHLHNKQPGGFVRSLPSLETMEIILFQMISLGFVALTVSLLSGGFYLQDLFAQHLVHKTTLSVIAWLLFGILLWGRWRFGWRGRIAIRWTLGAFVSLMLAYFGSKFVIELLLGR